MQSSCLWPVLRFDPPSAMSASNPPCGYNVVVSFHSEVMIIYLHLVDIITFQLRMSGSMGTAAEWLLCGIHLDDSALHK